MRNKKSLDLIKLALALSFALPLAVAAEDPNRQPGGNGTEKQGASSQSSSAEQDNADGPRDSKLSKSDRKFVRDAAIGGLAEVELGRLGVEKAASDKVRQFAQHIVDDHSKANEELKALAESKGIELPSQLDRKHVKEVERLQALSGEEFDREYMKLMVADHVKDVTEFKHEAESGKDRDIKRFAKKTLPTLRGHLAMARDTRQALARAAGKTDESRHSNKADGSKDSARHSKKAGEADDLSGAAESERNRDSTAGGQHRVRKGDPVHSNPPSAANQPGTNGSDASSGDESARNRDSTAPAQQGQKQ